ncbi:hypothetical protein K6X12_06560 [Xanthomonas euvesicatoria pv. allii]|uniref:hypothetical protein n=1 Tax=Xanthomonas euvesicatoria TaxID=456327 RepID=UPI0024068FD7|nr:hypothetical protein [Xanthomonas euvesicatoria]MCP3050759.1 hypothetical protein [Xanthomonas euvesicatoria pv. allii]
MKRRNLTATVRRRYASKKHLVLKDADLRSAWTRMRIEAASPEVFGPILGFTVLGVGIGSVLGVGIGSVLGALITSGGGQFPAQISPLMGAVMGASLGFLVGLFSRNRPLTPLDDYDLEYISTAVGEEPELFGFIIEAVKRGDTLRYRDYTFVAAAYRAVRKAKIEDAEIEAGERRRNAAMARIIATVDGADDCDP